MISEFSIHHGQARQSWWIQGKCLSWLLNPQLKLISLVMIGIPTM